MSNAPVSVRFDVTGSDRVSSETRKIAKDLDALRTAQGGIVSSVKQMEAGFRTDALGNFSTAVTNADTKATGLRAKLAGFGGTLAQNATSFGVATASVWGIYNAYDSLEKVQIRAHAAAQRVATLETTIATLTLRREQAVAKGNLSAEQMAILDDRITNAHNKLAVAQERNADLQQDVNEAWAGFASQVGPQVVAAGASLVQLATNLKGSFGGVIPTIKNFFASFTGGGAATTMSQVNAQWIQSAPALRNMSNGMKEAQIAASGLSTAMKGLLLGGGIAVAIFAIGEAIAFFRDQEINAIINSKAMNDAISQSDQAMQDFNDTAAKAQKTLDVVVKGFGADFQKLIDKAQELSVSVNLAAVTADISKQRNAIVDLNGPITALKQKYMEVTHNASFFDIISGKLTDAQNKLATQITDLTNKQNAHGASIKTDTALIDRLRASLALKAGVQNKDTEFILEAVAAGYSFADAAQLLNVLTEGGTKSLNDHANALIHDNKEKKTAQQITDEWLRTTADKIDSDKAENVELQKLAVAAGLVADGSKNTNEHLKQLLETYLKTKAGIVDTTVAMENQQEVLKAHAKAFEDSFKASNDAIDAEKEKNDAFQNSIVVQKEMVAQTFGAAEAAQKAGESNTDYKTRLTQLSDIAQVRIDEEKKYTLGLIQTATNLGLNVTRQADLTAAMHEGDAALQDLILSDQTLIDHLTEENRLRDLTNQGLVDGRARAIDFLDTTDRQIASNQQYLADLDTMAKFFDVTLPAGLDHTITNMEDLVATAQGSPEAFDRLKKSMTDLIETDFAPFNKKLDDVLGKWSDKEGRKKLENFMKDIFPKDVRKEVKLWLDFQTDEKRQKDRIEFIIATLLRPAGGKTFMINPGIEIDPKDVDNMLRKWKSDIKKNTDKDERGPDSLNGIFLNGINKALEAIKQGKNPLEALKDLFNDPTLQAALEASGVNLFTSSIVDSIKNSTLPEDAKQKMIDLVNQANPGAVPIDIMLDPTFKIFGAQGAGSEALEDIFRPEGGWGADTLRAQIEKAIGSTTPIEVTVTANIEQFLKGANNVASVTDFIDKLRPIVDFLGDHSSSGNFMKAAKAVTDKVAAIDKLRPIVDFLGDHRQFMKAADDVQGIIDDIDGTVVKVEFHATRTGNWSTKIAQHGLHEILTEDTLILAHKGEKVDINPPGSPSVTHNMATYNSSVSSGPAVLHVEMPVYLFPGGEAFKKFIKEIPLAETGNYGSA